MLGGRFVHPPSQFLLDRSERCPRAIAPCCSFDNDLPTAVAFTDEAKAKKVEGLRFAEPAKSSSFCREAAELDPAGLVRIRRQRELLEPLAHIVPEAPGVRSCSKPTAMSSAYRMRIMSPVASCRRQRARTRDAGRRWRAAVRLPIPARSPFH